MKYIVRDIPVNYEEYGKGKPIICLHGYSLDHRMWSGCLEPVLNTSEDYRRIYMDLPGMGKTPSGWVKTSDNMLEVIMGFINEVIGNENFLVMGESFGGFLTLGLLCKMPERIDGAVLLAPLISHQKNRLPEKRIIWISDDVGSPEDDPELKSFLDDFAVIVTPDIFERYKNEILSGIKIGDQDFLWGGGFTGETDSFESMIKSVKFDKPACIVTGRQDHGAGYAQAFDLLDKFPRATFTVLDCAGHNLQIENEKLFNQLIRDFIWRVEILPLLGKP